MKKLGVILILNFLVLNSFSQIDSQDSLIYDFINQIKLPECSKETYFDINATPRSLIDRMDSLNFDYRQCMFMPNTYYFDTLFWEANLSEADKDYMVLQIKELKGANWEKEKINQKICFISGRDIKKYSKEVMKYERNYEKGKGTLDKIPLKTIVSYSVPIFNKGHNLALVYVSFYSGPLSGSWGINVYVYKNGEWVNIGYEPIAIS